MVLPPLLLLGWNAWLARRQICCGSVCSSIAWGSSSSVVCWAGRELAAHVLFARPFLTLPLCSIYPYAVPVEHPIKGQAIYAFVTLMVGTSYPPDEHVKKELVAQVGKGPGLWWCVCVF